VIIIPAFNEQDTIGGVVDQLKRFCPIIVVDDGSTDATYQKCKLRDVNIVRHQHNKGYGATIKAGLSFACEMDFKYAITIDADGQHDFKDVPLIYELLKSGSHVAVGNRNKLPRLAEKVFSWYTARTLNIDDPLCGFKGYNLDACREFIQADVTCIAGTGVAIAAARNKMLITNFTTHVVERSGSPRYGNRIHANLKIFYALIASIWNY
jgi:glycosyltransferase involved in cell wall biosynthesis